MPLMDTWAKFSSAIGDECAPLMADDHATALEPCPSGVRIAASRRALFASANSAARWGEFGVVDAARSGAAILANAAPNFC